MATKTRKPKKSTAPRNYRVRIRMYRQGLGDCFLLTFPAGRGKSTHLLIDCGVVLGTGEPGVVMKKVAEDIRDTTKGRIDVLAITHEHWDHLSGFDAMQARAIFAKMKVGQLWLAWTEDDTDDLANSLREERERKKAAAKAAKEAAKKLKNHERVKRLSALLGFFGATGDDDASEEAEAGGGTAGALKFLRGIRKPTILETGSTRLLPGHDDVRVYVVGPPRDGDAMRQTNPSKGEGYGLANPPIGLTEAFLAAFDEKDERAQPFATSMRLPMDELKKAAKQIGQPEPLPGLDGYYHAANAWRNIDNDWIATGERLALQLDNATNNTSMVLAFEFGDGDVLLFVGDAQAGNWRSWESCKWSVKDGDGERRTVTAADLLKRTIFYKVGHHGSHNATLRAKGLEQMKSDRLAAFIPVDTKVAHNVKGWKHMPLPAIRKRLKEKCAILFQSDEPTATMKDAPGVHWLEATKTFDVRMTDPRTKKLKTVRKQPLYTDCYL